ncbi:MAG: glycogen/starch/alpha-glucan phosphorylase [Spirochaetia bacterium]
MSFNRKDFKQQVQENLRYQLGKPVAKASKRDVFEAVSKAVMKYVLDNWLKTKDKYRDAEAKQTYYLSAEFLMGRTFGNNLVNMLIKEDVQEVLNELGFDYNLIEDEEPDAGLGNGGLGRLAACFLDSLATGDLPGHGYGIRYKYGMFKQRIIDGYQVEFPDTWLERENPWSIRRADESVEVKFGGHVVVLRDEKGREHFKRVNAEIIRAIPYDMPICGYKTKNVNTLRLWEAESPDGFNLQLFNDQQYLRAVEAQNKAEDISRVLYPNDSGPSGKALRLRQQYFFVSASLQDIVRRYKEQYGTNFKYFPEKVAIQLNDTHPVVGVPELMRILMDWEKLYWDEAWWIVTNTFAYTNHTILAEALEKWPIDLFNGLMPRIYQIVEEINRRFLTDLRKKYPRDWEKQRRMAIISDGVIKMAWLAIVGSHSVNGVAALHTEILKNSELKDWYEFYPDKFNNKTNGVTQRRWLLKSNDRLAQAITKRIGEDWITDLPQLKKLEQHLDEDELINEFLEIKHQNKKDLAEYILEHNGVKIDPSSIYDIQIKRLHEYKRQLMNVLHIMYLYNKLKEDPDLDIYPRTFIFGAKAASGYKRAKDIIKLINTVGDKINNDPSIKDKIKVVFLENYRVSLAEKMFPAADVSEQISTAGKEASGTGNMKFMLNGAVTIGTLDGANIEIVEEAGEENAFIFGLTATEIQEVYDQYSPWDEYEANPQLKEVVEQLIDGTYNPGSAEIFKELYDSLMFGIDGNKPDTYLVLKDFNAYVKAQEEVDKAFRDRRGWALKALKNIANAGKFSSDRTIQQYAEEIWNIKPVRV